MKESNFSLYIDGIKNPKVRVKGPKKGNIKLLIDGKEYELSDNIILDKDYVEKRILKIKDNFIDKYSSIPFNSKKALLYVDDKLIIKKNISFCIRIFSRVLNVFYVFRRLPKIMFKTIKLMWKRHHFIIPFRMMKQYFNSFLNNIDCKNVDELFYNPLVDLDYRKWINEQENNISYENLKYKPLISVIIPTYNVSKKLLSECIDSVLNQSYDNFEICIADDNSSNDETINTLKKYEKNKKIKVVYRDINGHISEASNSAIDIASGEYIALLDNDDVLDKDALYYMVLELNKDKSLDMVYSDEDKLDFNGERCFPHFKPDFSLDTLLSSNYICHFTIIRRSIVNKLGGFRSEYNGAQDYDLFLRVVDKTQKIGHVSKILYHWRMTEGSTSSKGGNKNYAYDAGKRALDDYFCRNNINALVHLIGEPQMYQVEYLYDKEPLISIIIPTKDRSDILDNCLNSIYSKTSYNNYEVIVIDNNSTEEKTFDLLSSYKKKYDNFSFYRYECEFNYSYLNNEGVKKSKGDYIVLLNNDTEVISGDWLSYMVGYAMQKHVGCVGAKLLYPNRTIQHSGVVIGCGGIAMHALVSTGENEFGYFGRLVSVYDWSCVTAACLMVSKDKFNLVNGLDENIKVAYNDVDFNLKLLDKGLNNVVLPFVKLYHYESLSRGDDLSDSQIKRFKKETDFMCDKWETKLLSDKFYNDNLSYKYAFRLDRIEK